MPVVLGLFVSIIWRLRVRVKSWSYWIHRVLAFSLIEVYLIALCVFILTSNANHKTQQSNVGHAQGVNCGRPRADFPRIFKGKRKHAKFQGKHKNQPLYCKISEGIKFMTICKGSKSRKKGKLETYRTQRLFKYRYPATSFPGSLIFPPPGAPGGRKMRDPGNEVGYPVDSPICFELYQKKGVRF